MARVKYSNSDINLMARMMRAEAEGEGRQGMLYVGNVIVNRLAANCIDFKNLRTVSQVIYQVQGGIIRLKLFKKAMCFIKEQEVLKKD
jgi:N-acetylmuramoyl-L-alanine amidase